MYSIEITTDKENYSIIKVSDIEGLVCSYCGYDNKPFLWLLEEYNIDCR